MYAATAIYSAIGCPFVNCTAIGLPASNAALTADYTYFRTQEVLNIRISVQRVTYFQFQIPHFVLLYSMSDRLFDSRRSSKFNFLMYSEFMHCRDHAYSEHASYVGGGQTVMVRSLSVTNKQIHSLSHSQTYRHSIFLYWYRFAENFAESRKPNTQNQYEL